MGVMDYDKYLGLMGVTSSLGHMSPLTSAMAANQGGSISNMAQAHAQKQAEKEAEKAEKSGKLGKLGSALGMIGGSLIPGVGPILGPALGSALGGTVGQAAGGGGVNMMDSLGYAGQGAANGLMRGIMNPVAPTVSTGTQAAGGQAASNAAMAKMRDAIPGANSVIAPPSAPTAAQAASVAPKTVTTPGKFTGPGWDAARETLTAQSALGMTGLSEAMQPDPARHVQWKRDMNGNLVPVTEGDENKRTQGQPFRNYFTTY